MREILDTLLEYAEEHWLKAVSATVFMALGWFFGRYRARSRWRKRQFYDRLNVSLNTIDEGTLRIRTLVEKSCEEVFLNKAAVEAITSAAWATTESDPLVALPRDDYWFYLNAVLNEVAERFSEGQIRRDLGLPVTSVRYLVCLTCEKAGAVRTQKIRAMLVQKKLLEHLPDEPTGFEAENHRTRWHTLQKMAAEYRSNPHRFLELEICV